MEMIDRYYNWCNEVLHLVTRETETKNEQLKDSNFAQKTPNGTTAILPKTPHSDSIANSNLFWSYPPLSMATIGRRLGYKNTHKLK